MLGQRVEAGQSRQAIWTGSAWRWVGDQGGDSQIHIQKPTDETINNVGALQNDDHLTFAIWANETWIWEMLVDYTSTVAQDINFAITAPAGATCVYSVMDYDEGTLGNANTACPTAIRMTTDSATDESALISFSVVNGGTAGNITLQWAQGTAAAVNTTVHDGSYLHAYRVRWADYAEIYYTEDSTITKWDIVSLTGDGISQVWKSTTAYDSKALGIISTKPGMVLGEPDGSGKPVIVGLSGRVPVKVTTKNGAITSWDYITTSDIPWVGMKATEPGRVIGKALTSYAWEEIGSVMVFIENSFYDGVNEWEYREYLSGNALTLPQGSLDRFSFMVKKSLGKIGSGHLNFLNTGSSTAAIIEAFSGIENTLESQKTQIWNIENNLLLLSWSIDSLRQWQINSQQKVQENNITNVTNNYILTNSGTEWEAVTSIEEKSSLEVITDVLEYITNLIVDGVRVIKEIVALRIVAIEAQFDQLFAKYARIDIIENTEITTKKLCIDGTNTTSCISEKDLRKLLEKSTPPPAQPTTLPEPTPTPVTWNPEDQAVLPTENIIENESQDTIESNATQTWTETIPQSTDLAQEVWGETEVWAQEIPTEVLEATPPNETTLWGVEENPPVTESVITE